MKQKSAILRCAICICMLFTLCSCTDKKPENQPPVTSSESQTEYRAELSTEKPEPVAGSIGTAKKKAHSYGVAKNGEAHEISKNAQRYFEENSLGAFCLDTKSQEKRLYLTFDCGYENGYTSKIIDILKEENVNAAFFCTLPQVKENPELIKRMIDEGHIVGNHSVTHPSFAEISREKAVEEVRGMESYLKENFNYSEPYFRFPKGEYTDDSIKALNEMGYSCVFWSLAYADWDLNAQKGTEYAFSTVTARLHPGAVILLHSVSPDNAGALKQIIDYARAEGYTFASLRDFPKN